MSVAICDLDGQRGAEVICFSHKPDPKIEADWRSLADVAVQIRDGKTGRGMREATPRATDATS